MRLRQRNGRLGPFAPSLPTPLTLAQAEGFEYLECDSIWPPFGSKSYNAESLLQNSCYLDGSNHPICGTSCTPKSVSLALGRTRAEGKGQHEAGRGTWMRQDVVLEAAGAPFWRGALASGGSLLSMLEEPSVDVVRN
jgi:hypothetical protein